VAENSSGQVAETKRHSALVNFLTRLVKEKPLGTVGLTITLLLLLTGIFADFIAPYGMNQIHAGNIMVPPSAQFWFGTDTIARDVLSRVIHGARVSTIVGLSAACLQAIGSCLLGVVSGYIGGKFDLIVQRFVDAWMCFPGIVIMMIIISTMGPGMLSVIIVLGLQYSVTGSRIVRGSTLQIKQNVYVQAAVAIGCSHQRILFRHILPHIMAPLIVLFSVRVPNIIRIEASLSFLGFGIPPPAPSWGGMLSGMARSHMLSAPWMIIWPGAALALVVYGINMFGDAVRDILDPRLRGGVGRYGVSVKKESNEKSEPNTPEGLTKQ